MKRKEIGLIREWLEKGDEYLNDAESEAKYIEHLCDDTQDRLDRIGVELADAESELSDVRALESQINDYIDSAKDQYFEIEKILRDYEAKIIQSNMDAKDGGLLG